MTLELSWPFSRQRGGMPLPHAHPTPQRHRKHHPTKVMCGGLAATRGESQIEVRSRHQEIECRRDGRAKMHADAFVSLARSFATQHARGHVPRSSIVAL